jgi:AcrR family transcriptional regulator
MFMFVLCDHEAMNTATRHRRRQPMQERSRQRVERILAAALNLLEESGGAAVTTRAIAERAGVPVATLYQFFPNREAILEEILLAYLDHRDADAAATLAQVQVDTLEQAVASFFEFHREQYRSHPKLVALYYAQRGRGAIPDPRAHRAWIAELIHTYLTERALVRSDLDQMVLMVAIEIGDRVVELAYRADPNGDPAILREGQVALTRYLQAYSPT